MAGKPVWTTPERQAPETVENQGPPKKKNYGRFFWPILRGIVVILALWGFLAFLQVRLYGGELGITTFAVFVLASLALSLILFEPATPLLASETESTGKARQYRLPEWSLIAYLLVFGLGCNWDCVFLWFSRRYDPLSATVVGATSLLMAFYAAVAIIVARLTTKNWRTAVLIFAFGPGALAGIVLRLGLLR